MELGKCGLNGPAAQELVALEPCSGLASAWSPDMGEETVKVTKRRMLPAPLEHTAQVDQK
jgi:hypothetical protein